MSRRATCLLQHFHPATVTSTTASEGPLFSARPGMAVEPVSTVTEERIEQRTFHWTDTAEPHSARRRAMLQKYGPQIRALYGNDPWTAYQVRQGHDPG